MTKLCRRALQHNWSGNPQKPVKANVLSFLLTTYFECCDDGGRAAEELALHAVPEMMSSVGVDDATQELESSSGKTTGKRFMISSSFATLTKSTFPVYFRVMMATLAKILTKAHVYSDGQVNVVELLSGKGDYEMEVVEDAEAIVEAQLASLGCISKVIFGLVKLTKFQSVRSKAIMLATIKNSRVLIENFIKYW